MKKLAMGIDIGGTNTAFGLVDEEGTIFCESAISTERYKKFDDYNAYVEALCEAMHALIGSVSFDFELIGIGIGAPNANFHTGMIEAPANLWKFRDNEENPDESRRMFHFVDDIKASFPGVDVAITNDANAAGMKDFVVITLGTGLGSGIVSNGELVYGHDGFAGEYGHVAVDSRVHGRDCGCGRKGCLEAYASATGIKRTAFELMAKMSCDSELRDTPYSKFEAVMLSVAADKGDAIAKEAFRYTGEVLGKALADLMATTSPEAIILFGGLAKAGKYIFEPTKWYMEENMMATFKNKVKLLPSGIEGKNAAILGSSALIWQNQIK